MVYTSQWDNLYYDSSFGIAIDNSSNALYITGESHEFGPNCDAFILKYNNSLGSQDTIQAGLGDSEDIGNNNDSQNDNKAKTSINGYNIAIFLLGINLVLFYFLKDRKKYNTHT